ncbi:MAG: hypothetical protein K9L74_00205 [Candidatus Izimaplasma sp.]|nr:hypothetical protein [Candidatus Izimaplasma bacterium]
MCNEDSPCISRLDVAHLTHTSWGGKRWIRLAAEYPEQINYVDFYRNEKFVYRSYDEPYFLFRETTWIQKPWHIKKDDRKWTAEVVLLDGTKVIKSVSV